MLRWPGFRTIGARVALFNLIVKESVSASKALTGHIDGIDRADAREKLKCAVAAEK